MSTLATRAGAAGEQVVPVKPQRNVFPFEQTLASAGAALFGLLVVFAATRESVHGSAATMMVGLSSMAIGALVGFLFGVPPANAETHSDRRPLSGAERDVNGKDGPDSAHERLVQNTSLQEISSWLTKIIVGAGLVNLHGLARWIGEMGLAISNQVQLKNFGQIFGSASIVYFFVVGFISAYTYTRTKVASLFAESDRSILALFEKRMIDANTRTVNEVAQRTQAVVDDKFQEIVQQQDSMRKVVESNTQAVLESRMLSALYEPRPKGYELVLELAEESERNETLTAKGWYFLACALGQRLAFEKPDETKRAELMKKAVRAFERLRSDDVVRTLALRLLRGELGKDDDDFVEFQKDPQFGLLLTSSDPPR